MKHVDRKPEYVERAGCQNGTQLLCGPPDAKSQWNNGFKMLAGNDQMDRRSSQAINQV